MLFWFLWIKKLSDFNKQTIASRKIQNWIEKKQQQPNVFVHEMANLEIKVNEIQYCIQNAKK